MFKGYTTSQADMAFDFLTHCNTLHHTAPHCTALHHNAPHCTTLHHTAPDCTTLHHTATHCNTLQRVIFSIRQAIQHFFYICTYIYKNMANAISSGEFVKIQSRFSKVSSLSISHSKFSGVTILEKYKIDRRADF